MSSHQLAVLPRFERLISHAIHLFVIVLIHCSFLPIAVLPYAILIHHAISFTPTDPAPLPPTSPNSHRTRPNIYIKPLLLS